MGDDYSDEVDKTSETIKEREMCHNNFPKKDTLTTPRKEVQDTGVNVVNERFEFGKGLSMRFDGEKKTADMEELFKNNQLEKNRENINVRSEKVHGGVLEKKNARGHMQTNNEGDFSFNGKINQAIFHQTYWSLSAEKIRQGFSCHVFTIADVEEKMKNDKGGETKRRASDSITWKRKEKKDEGLTQVKSLVELRRKRKKKSEIEEEEFIKEAKLREDNWVLYCEEKLMDWEWWWLVPNPANHNDRFKLELSRARAPSNSSRPLPVDKGKEARLDLSHRD